MHKAGRGLLRLVLMARATAGAVSRVIDGAWRGAAYLVAAAASVYLLSILWASLSGWALPSTALIRWSPIAAWLAQQEIYLSDVLLIVAAVGIVMRWLYADGGESFRVGRWFWPVAAVCMVCLFIFSMSGMWAGILRTGDFQYANLGGLVPYSDSFGHLAAAYDFARDGVWSTFALRRPLAAAFRETLLFFSGGSYPIMQFLQVTLLALSTCLATSSVAKWSGKWSAIVFFVLTYTYVRVFAPLTLSEGLGLIPALLIVPFVIEALRAKSIVAALIALAFLMIGLMMRMGSMFTIPMFIIWIAIHFGYLLRSRLYLLFVGASICAVVLALNSVMKQLYGTSFNDAGTNFSYTLCGLTLGTTWDGCVAKMASAGPMPGSELELTKALYAMAWENFRTQPSLFFFRISDGMVAFVSEIPDLLFRGYLNEVRIPSWFFPKALLVLFALTAVCYVRQLKSRGEAVFWLLFLISLIASSGIVYFDDGKRALAVTYPLLFLFIARVISAPTWETASAISVPDTKLQIAALCILCLGMPTLLLTPWIAHRSRSQVDVQYADVKTQPSQALVLGGRSVVGFLVVADGEPLRHDVPSLNFTDFANLVRASNIEFSQGLINPEEPPLPFGFVFAPRVESGIATGRLYIVPADVMVQRDVKVWRLDCRPWQRKLPNPEYWQYVTHAEPVGPS